MGVACLSRPNHVLLYAHRLSYRWRLHAKTLESATCTHIYTAVLCAVPPCYSSAIRYKTKNTNF